MHEDEALTTGWEAIINDYVDPVAKVPEAEPEHPHIGEAAIGVQRTPVVGGQEGLAAGNDLPKKK